MLLVFFLCHFPPAGWVIACVSTHSPVEYTIDRRVRLEKQRELRETNDESKTGGRVRSEPFDRVKGSEFHVRLAPRQKDRSAVIVKL